VTKSELIELVAQEANLTKGRAELVINTIFESMVDALRRDEGIEIRGFGSFTVRQYKSYEGRNPRTGDTVHVAPKRLPFFKVGKELRKRINGERPDGAAPEPRRTQPPKPATPAPQGSKTPARPGTGVSEDVI